jgi:cytoskeleton protein RodZ
LVIQAVEESWVEVTDAFGNRVFTSLMMPGDYTVLDQPSSMSVVVGNASGVVAHTRGQPVDVQGNARGNVSRFDIR